MSWLCSHANLLPTISALMHAKFMLSFNIDEWSFLFFFYYQAILTFWCSLSVLAATIFITYIQAWTILMLWVSTICVYESTFCHDFYYICLNQCSAPVLITQSCIRNDFSLVWKLLISMYEFLVVTDMIMPVYIYQTPLLQCFDDICLHMSPYGHWVDHTYMNLFEHYRPTVLIIFLSVYVWASTPTVLAMFIYI